MSLPLGYMLDRYGTWIFRSFVTILFTLGCGLLAASTPSTSGLLYPSFSLIALSGNALLVSNLQVANLVKSFRGLILTFSNAPSEVVFFLVKKGYDADFELQHLLLVLPFITIFSWIRTFLLMPKKFIPFEVPERGFHYGYRELRCFQKPCSNNAAIHLFPIALFAIGASSDQMKKIIEQRESQKAEKSKSLLSCLKRTLLWTNMFHLSAVALRRAFTYGILQQWMEVFASSEQVSKLRDDFGLIVIFAAIISPIFDAFVKRLSNKTGNSKLANLKATIISMASTSIFAILLSLTMVLFNSYGTFVFTMLIKGFANGGFATFLAVNFPAQHIGKLVGIAYVIAGTVTLLQYSLLKLAFSFDPTFYYTNLGILIATALSLLHPLLIYLDAKKLAKTIETENNINNNKLQIWLQCFVLVMFTILLMSSWPPTRWYCNCNYILLTKLFWPRDSEGTFRSSIRAHRPTCLVHTVETSNSPFNFWASSRKAVNINFSGLPIA